MASLWNIEPPSVSSPLGVSDLRLGLWAGYKYSKVTWGWKYRQAISTVKLPAQQVVVYSFSHRLQSIVLVAGSPQGQL